MTRAIVEAIWNISQTLPRRDGSECPFDNLIVPLCGTGQEIVAIYEGKLASRIVASDTNEENVRRASALARSCGIYCTVADFIYGGPSLITPKPGRSLFVGDFRMEKGHEEILTFFRVLLRCVVPGDIVIMSGPCDRIITLRGTGRIVGKSKKFYRIERACMAA